MPGAQYWVKITMQTVDGDNKGNNGQNMIYMYVSLGHLFWVGYNSNNNQNSCTNETNAVMPVQENLTVWLQFTQQDYQE